MESFLISTSSRFLLEERIDYLNCFTHFTQWEYVFIIRGIPFLKAIFLLIQCLAITVTYVLFCGLVFISKKVGASIKNPLLGLKQP